MQDHIPDALITAFERQYDSSWNDPQLRNERLAMRYGWAAAMEAKPCLHQIQEPAPVLAALAAVAVPDGWKLVPDAENMTDEQAEAIAELARVCGGGALDIYRAALESAPEHAALAATPAEKPNSVEFDGIKTAAPVVLPEPVEFQCRVKPDWDEKHPWTDWEKCKPESASDYLKNPTLHNWTYEVRKLFTEQQLRALLATGGQAQAVTKDEAKWCSYIAGMIGCYLKEGGESPRIKAIAGIIERRLWALPAPWAKADARDAGRYRDLRELLCGQDVVIDEATLILKVTGQFPTIEEFDAGVDSAIAAAKGE